MSVATQTLGWGVVGCGWVAREFVLPAIARDERSRAVAGCDPDEAARLAAGTERRYARVEDLLADPGVDAVYVATPNHLHRPLVEAAAAAGKHVLCEKPMATSVADARAMVEACERAEVLYATAFDQRFHPAHVALREHLPAVGTVTAVRIVYCCWLPADWVADNWRVDPDRAGGGALIDLAPHGVDLVHTLLGEPLEDVAVLDQRRVHAYAVDDGAMLVGRTASGVLASLHVAYNHPEDVPRRRLEVVGTTGLLTATDTMGQTPGGRLELHDGTEVPFDADASPFDAQIAAFTAAALDGTPFPYGPDQDLRTMELLCR